MYFRIQNNFSQNLLNENERRTIFIEERTDINETVSEKGKNINTLSRARASAQELEEIAHVVHKHILPFDKTRGSIVWKLSAAFT